MRGVLTQGVHTGLLKTQTLVFECLYSFLLFYELFFILLGEALSPSSPIWHFHSSFPFSLGFLSA